MVLSLGSCRWRAGRRGGGGGETSKRPTLVLVAGQQRELRSPISPPQPRPQLRQTKCACSRPLSACSHSSDSAHSSPIPCHQPCHHPTPPHLTALSSSLDSTTQQLLNPQPAPHPAASPASATAGLRPSESARAAERPHAQPRPPVGKTGGWVGSSRLGRAQGLI